jgi:hypothetical protein
MGLSIITKKLHSTIPDGRSAGIGGEPQQSIGNVPVGHTQFLGFGSIMAVILLTFQGLTFIDFGAFAFNFAAQFLLTG